MKLLLSLVQQFLRDHNLSSHTLVGAFGAFTGYLAVDAQSRNLVFAFLDHHKLLALAFGLASFAYAKYSAGHTITAQAATVARKMVESVDDKA